MYKKIEKSDEKIEEIFKKIKSDYKQLFSEGSVNEMNEKIFISHLSKDEKLAKVLTDIMVQFGISRKNIFCSSIPGQDVSIGEKIDDTVKTAIKESKVIIFIITKDFYSSAYCLNEMGAAWILEKHIIPIMVEPMSHKDMQGFINSNYLIANCNSEQDINKIYSSLTILLGLPVQNVEIIKQVVDKFIKDIEDVLTIKEVKMVNESKNVESSNLNNNIDLRELTKKEKVFLKYVVEEEEYFWGARGQNLDSYDRLKSWEDINFIGVFVSASYDEIILDLADRNVLIPTQYTSYGNAKQYRLQRNNIGDIKQMLNDNADEIAKIMKEVAPF